MGKITPHFFWHHSSDHILNLSDIQLHPASKGQRQQHLQDNCWSQVWKNHMEVLAQRPFSVNLFICVSVYAQYNIQGSFYSANTEDLGIQQCWSVKETNKTYFVRQAVRQRVHSHMPNSIRHKNLKDSPCARERHSKYLQLEQRFEKEQYMTKSLCYKQILFEEFILF